MSNFIYAGVDYKPFKLQGINSLLDSWTDYVFVYKYIIDHEVLRASLELALKDFPVFSGRKFFSSDRIYYAVDDLGVRFEYAKRVESFMPQSYAQSSFICDTTFRAKHRISNTSLKNSLLQIKITEFTDATVIGVSVWHAISDGAFFLNFLGHWCDCLAGRRGNQSQSFYEFDVCDDEIALKPYSVELAHTQLKLNSSYWTKQVRFIIDESSADIPQEMQINNIDSVMGYFWKIVAGALNEPLSSEITLHNVYNIRPWIGLADNVAGNLLHFATTSLKLKEIQDLSAFELGSEIRKRSIQLFLDEENLLNMHRYLAKTVTSNNKLNLAIRPVYDCVFGNGIIANNLTGLDFSKLSFGHGGPSDFYTPPEEAGRFLSIHKNPSNTKSLIVTINAPEEEIEKIIRFVPFQVV